MAIGVPNFPTTLDAASDLVEATNDALTTLTSNITSSSSTIPVVSTANFPNTGILKIGTELIAYSSKAADSFSVQTSGRGYEGSVAAAALSGNLVELVITAASNNAKNTAIIALETKIGTGSSTPTANTVLRGTGTGTSAFGQVGLTTDVTGTLPVANGGTGNTTYTAGQLLIGNSTGGLTKATLTAGTNITITNGNDGSITIGSAGGGVTTGKVIALAMVFGG